MCPQSANGPSTLHVNNALRARDVPTRSIILSRIQMDPMVRSGPAINVASPLFNIEVDSISCHMVLSSKLSCFDEPVLLRYPFPTLSSSQSLHARRRSDITRMADLEKNTHDENLERASTKETNFSPQTSLDKVQTHETLARVDIHNSQAFKGDDSDGKFNWSIRKWIAAAFLAMLYTGRKHDLNDNR